MSKITTTTITNISPVEQWIIDKIDNNNQPLSDNELTRLAYKTVSEQNLFNGIQRLVSKNIIEIKRSPRNRVFYELHYKKLHKIQKMEQKKYANH